MLGSEVARATGLAVGAAFAGSHGLAEGGGEHGDAPYRVVGVLAPTGTVVDRLVLTGIESVWAVHDAHGHAEHHDEPGAAAETGAEAASPAREVTLALVRYSSPLAAASLPRAINSRDGAAGGVAGLRVGAPAHACSASASTSCAASRCC